jgi:hypothetical protein
MRLLEVGLVTSEAGPLVLLGVETLYVAARAGTCHCRGGSTGPARDGGLV